MLKSVYLLENQNQNKRLGQHKEHEAARECCCGETSEEEETTQEDVFSLLLGFFWKLVDSNQLLQQDCSVWSRDPNN